MHNKLAKHLDGEPVTSINGHLKRHSLFSKTHLYPFFLHFGAARFKLFQLVQA